MQYSSRLVVLDSADDAVVISNLVGCLDPACTHVNTEDPVVHFSLETWTDGIVRVHEQSPKNRPPLLNVLDYNLDDGYYLWRKVATIGLQDAVPIELDHYASYNVDNYKPHKYFDHWTRLFELIPSDSIVKCSDIFSGAYFGGISGINATQTLQRYSQLTNDTNFSCAMNDSIWFSPACRHNTSECVPLILQYYLDFAMQRAHFLNMPLAIIMVEAGAAYDQGPFKDAVHLGAFLFHTFLPNDNLFDAEGDLPILLNLPRRNDHDQAAGIFVTGREGLKARNYGWRGLKAAGPYVHFFASSYNLADHDVAGFMRQVRELKLAGLDPDAAAWEVACGWVRANAEMWQDWVPAICPPGQVSDASLTECLPCPTGSSCPGGTEDPSPCPPAFYCPPNASRLEPCPQGRVAPGAGLAAGPEGCSECVAGGWKVGGGCVPSVALVFAIAVPLFCLVGVAKVARRACLPEEEEAVRRGVREIRRRLEIRRRDGYVVGGEWVPVWLWWRREALVFLRHAHVKAAVHLALLRWHPQASFLPPSPSCRVRSNLLARLHPSLHLPLGDTPSQQPSSLPHNGARVHVPDPYSGAEWLGRRE
jgi:hypothetical protein